MGWGPADILALVVAVLNSGIVEAVVRLVERLLPAASGPAKKFEAMKTLGLELPEHGQRVVAAAIDAVVDEYNRSGVFTHRATSPGGGVASSGDPGSSSGFAR
jgi:hypothetical protein